MSSKRKTWTDDDEAFCRRHWQTMTAADFAQHFGVSKWAVGYFLRSRQIKLRHKGWTGEKKYTTEQVLQARQLRNQGLTHKQIADQTGINFGYLCELLSPKRNRRRDAIPATPKAQPGPVSQVKLDRIENVVQRVMLSWEHAA